MNWLFGGNKVWVFYSIRLLLAFICSLGETLFIEGVRRFFGKMTSVILFFLLLCSSGMYTASTSRGFKKTLLYAVVIVSLVLGVDLAITYHFTHRLTIPAVNIVLYNVLGIGGSADVRSLPSAHI